MYVVVLDAVRSPVPMGLFRTLRDRARRYHPALESFIFGLALLGIIDVIHLYIQKSHQFEDGCFGFSTLQAAESSFDCAAVTSSAGSQLFGVSNITLGLGFYLAVVAVTVLIFWVGPAVRETLQAARTGLLGGGFAYSVYLVYLQLFEISALCALCLVSAGIVAFMFGAQFGTFLSFSSPTDTDMPTSHRKRQVAIFTYLAAAALVVVGVDLTYFGGTGGGSPEPVQTSATPAPSSGSPAAQCQLDPSKDPVPENGASLIGFQDITKGNSDADVTIIEYFDPNCPHCKDFHDTMKKVVDAYADEVRFVYKPFPLRASSLPEIQALYVAHQSGKFTQMLEGQYARQGPQGISMSDVRAIASEIGMDPEVVSSRVNENDYRQHVLRSRKRAVEIGVNSTPTVLVNGHFLRSRSFQCMKTFIDRATDGTLGGSTSE